MKKQKISVWDIIKSKFFRNEKEVTKKKWVKERREICKKCPLNSKNISFSKYNFRMWSLYFANLFKPFCSVCGCEIAAKTVVSNAECPLEPPKWEGEFE